MIPFASFANRTVAVFGLGRSGLSAARALMAGGASVWAWDDSAERRRDADRLGVPLRDLYRADWAGVAALVLSPGVPLTHPRPHETVERARAAGVEVIGDVELFLRTLPSARIVGITGTNGKSTTTALLGHILESCGRAVEAGGNLGTPVAELGELGYDGIYVLELSSYQIDLTPSLRPDVAVLLNIAPDHLDRHGDLAGYAAVKRRVFDGQAAGATAVIGVDDSYCRAIHDDLRAQGRHRLMPVAVVERDIDNGIHVIDGELYDSRGAGGRVADLRRALCLPGAHNWQNAAAAYAAARALGLESDEIVDAILTFPGLAHRMERVAEIGGVVYVNDSKATNADAVARALASYDIIYWVAGGLAKEGGIAGLAGYFARIRHAYLIGRAANDFAAVLGDAVPHTVAGDLATAVDLAARQAEAEGQAGAVVLLSPACASFDQFADFEARGDAFRELVLARKERAA